MTMDRAKWCRLYIQKWIHAPCDSFEEALYKQIAIALGYGASVRTVNGLSRRLRAEGV